MSILFMEDWGGGSWTVSTTRGWSKVSTGTTMSVQSSVRHIDMDGRGSAYMLQIEEQTAALSPTISGTPRGVCFACKTVYDSAGSSGDGVYWDFRKGGAVQCTVKWGRDGYIRAYRSTGTLLATSASTYSHNQMRWIAINAFVDNSGSIIVYLDGAEVLNTGTVDTQQGASAGWDQVAFGVDTNAGGVWNMYVGDVHVTDTTNTILAECSLLSTAPNADTTVTWTKSTGSTNYGTVDDIPYSTSDYNESTSSAQSDLLGTSPQAYAATSYNAAQVVIYAARDGTFTQIKSKVKSGPTTDTSSAATLGAIATYVEVVPKIWETDPNTSTAWTESSLNSADLGYESV